MDDLRARLDKASGVVRDMRDYAEHQRQRREFDRMTGWDYSVVTATFKFWICSDIAIGDVQEIVESTRQFLHGFEGIKMTETVRMSCDVNTHDNDDRMREPPKRDLPRADL